MITIVALIVAALILVFFEVILPGGILGLLALACIAAATFLGFNEYGAVGGIVVFLSSAVSVTFLVILEFKLMAKSRFRGEFFLDKTISGHTKKSLLDEVSGKEGVTVTRLNPSGKIEIEGKTYEAFSQDGYIEKAQKIVVVSKDTFKLNIKKL